MLYIDGKRLYRGFMAGSQLVISQKEYLNQINVFPVPDADTGANLAATMQNIISTSSSKKSLKAAAEELARNALTMARGNSGIIFSQFLYGLSQELDNDSRQTIDIFSQAVERAVDYMYKALLNPVEGTMITVIKEWAQGLRQHSLQSKDLHKVLTASLHRARLSLASTKNRLEALKKADVVDAGGMGFVLFLEGIINYLKTGILARHAIKQTHLDLVDIHDALASKYRFCCETLLSDLQIEPQSLISSIKEMGDSIAMAGGKQRLHLHIHTNEPTRVFHVLSQKASISNVKVDDMLWQHNLMENKKFNIGLLTDSAADFPQKLKEEFQINTIPIKIMFGDDIYLDKVTIDSDSFFKKIEDGSVFPRSSQPDPAQIASSLDFLSSHYDKLLAVTVSSKLSGIYNLMLNQKENSPEIEIFNSRQLSVSQGLLVLRAAQAVKQKKSFQFIKEKLPQWRNNTWIFTDIQSLDYMVRGGRVSPLKGKIAQMLNLKPIVSLDRAGKALAIGKSFSRKANMKKIVKLVEEKAKTGILWNYAIVHSQTPERAQKYAGILSQRLKKEPLYIMNIGPVVGVHNGLGACAVGLLVE